MKNFHADWLDKWARYTPDRLMIRSVSSGKEWTYFEFNNRINFLAKKSKTVGLSQQEKEEQQILRKEYLANFRENFKKQLNNIEIVD